MAFSPRYSAYPKAHGHYQAPSPGRQWHPQLCGVLSFSSGHSGQQPFIPERLSVMAGALGGAMSHTLYRTISLSGSAFLEVETSDEHLPEHMERALRGTKLKPKVSKSNVKI